MTNNDIKTVVTELVNNLGGNNEMTEDVLDIINDNSDMEWNNNNIENLINDYVDR